MDAGQPGVKQVVRFDEIFLESIRQRGRVHELGLIMRFNLAARAPFKDAHLAPVLLAKGKLNLFGHRIQEVTRIKQIFQKSKPFFLR